MRSCHLQKDAITEGEALRTELKGVQEEIAKLKQEKNEQRDQAIRLEAALEGVRSQHSSLLEKMATEHDLHAVTKAELQAKVADHEATLQELNRSRDEALLEVKHVRSDAPA